MQNFLLEHTLQQMNTLAVKNIANIIHTLDINVVHTPVLTNKVEIKSKSIARAAGRQTTSEITVIQKNKSSALFQHNWCRNLNKWE